MRLLPGRVRTAIVVAPHPDDEVIGAAGLIAALRRRGATVTVLVVSDGAASHPGSLRWPRRRLIAARRHESRRALRRLDVGARNLRFLDLPDGRLHSAACVRAIGRAVRQIGTPRLLVGPAGDDAHPDHRAVAAALSRLRPVVRRLSYRVWPARRARGAIPLPVAGGAAWKRSLIRCYATQNGAIRDDPAGFAIARHELDAFAHPIERYGAERR